jgi:hypothetical protein
LKREDVDGREEKTARDREGEMATRGREEKARVSSRNK